MALLPFGHLWATRFNTPVGGPSQYRPPQTLSMLSRQTNGRNRLFSSSTNYSEMLIAPKQIRNEFLRALSMIRHTGWESAITSVIAAGTFSLMRLSTSKSDLSPFNISSSVQMPYFSREETIKKFGMFAEDNYIRIDEAVIDDIWAKSILRNLAFAYIYLDTQGWSAFVGRWSQTTSNLCLITN